MDKPAGAQEQLVSPEEAENFTLEDIVDGNIPEPTGDEFYRMEDFF